MKIDLKHDLSTLTTINELAINRLFDKSIWCISDAVEQAVLAKDDKVEVDLGFGTISIKIDESQLKYKFMPSESLDSAIIATIINEKNELVCTIEKTLVSKITNIYKDMF